MNTPPDSAHDPWLREALRHAPDAERGVPAGVREGILKAAREAAAPAVVVSVQPAKPWWQALADAWLRPARLGYSGAFMALLVVCIWGVDQLELQSRHEADAPRPMALPKRASSAPGVDAVAALPAPPTVSPPAAAVGEVALAARPSTAPVPPAARDTTAPAPTPATAAIRRESGNAAQAAAAKAEIASEAPTAKVEPTAPAAVGALPPPSPAAPATPPAPSPEPAPAPSPASPPPPTLAEATPRVQAAPAPAPAPAPTAAMPPTLAQAEAPPSPAANQTAAMSRARNAASAAMPAPFESAADATLPKLSAQSNAAAPAVHDPTGVLLRRLSLLDPAGSELRWASTGYEGAHSTAQTEWLRVLQVQTAGRWQRVAHAVEKPAADLLLIQRGAPVAGFAFTTTPTVVWLTLGGTIYRAPLSDTAAVQLERLRAAW